MKNDIHSVICLWEWSDDHWKLAEAYGCDDDGYRIGDKSLKRMPWQPWLYHNTDSADLELEPIFGRCVTCWLKLSGVRLLDATPVGGYPEGLKWSELLKVLKGSWSWGLVLGGGLYIETMKEAERLMWPKENPGL